MKKRNIIISSVIFGLVLLDQLTKLIVIKTIELNEVIDVIPNFFVFTHVKNPGIAYGMLEGKIWFLYVISVLAVGLFYFLFKEIDFTSKKLYSYGVIAMAAGGIGNFIDRLFFKEVTDFLSLIMFDSAIFGVFNIADMCLVLGMVVFVIDVIFEDVLKWKKSS